VISAISVVKIIQRKSPWWRPHFAAATAR